MSGLKTFLLTLALLLPAQWMTSSPASALAERPSDMTPVFAACLGRYSAQVEDSWNAYSTDDTSQFTRARFEGLLDAVRTGSELTGSRILQIRLEAKWAQARLLSIARFDRDPRMQRRARAQAALALRPCEALLL